MSDKWIKYSESTPNDEEEVIYYDEYTGCVGFGFYYEEEIKPFLGERYIDGYFTDIDFEIVCGEDGKNSVTHWQYLPEAPKKEVEQEEYEL